MVVFICVFFYVDGLIDKVLFSHEVTSGLLCVIIVVSGVRV
jgi:hypothetical protein